MIKMGTTEQDVTELFNRFRTDRRIVIALNEHMYTVKVDLEDNWLFYTFYGYRELQRRLAMEGRKAGGVAIIGTGNGLDALGAYFVFEGLERLIMTDIDTRIIDLARSNVVRNLPDDKRKPVIYAVLGDLCRPVSDRMVDLAYGNLPNLPSESEDIDEGYKLSTLYHKKGGDPETSKIARDYRLEMQELFLMEARKILNPGGSVIPIIGGRVPYGLFPAMFANAGYRFEELCSGFKRQSEPEIDIPGYSKAEQNGIEFSFYDYVKAKLHMNKLGIPNPTTEINGEELIHLLSDFRITATEALKLYEQGIKIGHTVHFLRGVLE